MEKTNILDPETIINHINDMGRQPEATPHNKLLCELLKQINKSVRNFFILKKIVIINKYLATPYKPLYKVLNLTCSTYKRLQM